jgi:protease I
MRIFFILPILFALCCGAGGQQETEPQPPTSEEVTTIAKSVLMVIAPEDFRDEEFKEPHDLFIKSGIKVTVASTDTGSVRGMLGMIVKPDITLDLVNPDSFDAVVVVGGTGCKVLWDDTTLHNIVQNFNDKKKTTAAICIAPVVLARAGILKDVKATVYPAVKDDICVCGANYTGSEVEKAGNIITGSGPKSAKDFAETILRAISE